MTSLGPIADAAAKAVFTTFVVLGVGVLLAFANKIDRAGVSVVSTTVNYIFVPALLFNVFASSLSVAAFSYAWTLVVIGTVTIPIAWFFAHGMATLVKVEPYFKIWFVFGVTFQNTVALPLVFAASVCNTMSFTNIDGNGQIVYAPVFNSSGSSNRSEPVMLSPADCNERAVLYIFLYIFINSLMFWIIAFDVMPDKMIIPPPGSLSSANAEQRDDNEDHLPPEPLTPPLPPAARTESHSDPLVVRPPAVSTERPNIGRGEFATGGFAGGSFMVGSAEQERERFRRRLQIAAYLEYLPPPVRKFLLRCWLLFIRPPILAQILGMIVGLVAPLQNALYGPSTVLQPVAQTIILFAEGGTSVANLSLAAGLGIKLKEINWRHLFGGSPGGLSRRTTFAFVMTRMIVIPGVTIFLTWLVSPILPKDRLLMLILYIECFTPSANMVVVVPQILSNFAASDALALLVLAQYIIALPSMILWLSLSFYLTSDLP